jgi:RNA polymerase sigma factor (sigma-70 family)
MSGDHADRPTTIDLAVLTPRQRLVVVLHYFAGWSEREIADGMKLSRRSVRDLHQRALGRLRREHAHPAPISRA